MVRGSSERKSGEGVAEAAESVRGIRLGEGRSGDDAASVVRSSPRRGGQFRRAGEA